MLWLVHKTIDNQRTKKEDPKAIFLDNRGFEFPTSITKKMEVIKTVLISKIIYSTGSPPKDHRMAEQSASRAKLKGK